VNLQEIIREQGRDEDAPGLWPTLAETCALMKTTGRGHVTGLLVVSKKSGISTQLPLFMAEGQPKIWYELAYGGAGGLISHISEYRLIPSMLFALPTTHPEEQDTMAAIQVAVCASWTELFAFHSISYLRGQQVETLFCPCPFDGPPLDVFREAFPEYFERPNEPGMN
jgi:hypothetical protein